MLQRELIRFVAQDNEMPACRVKKIFDSTFAIIERTVAKGDNVYWAGFGTFKPKTHVARVVRNPATGEQMLRSEALVPKFMASKTFKVKVAKRVQ